MILAYDFEVFRHDWLVVIVDITRNEEICIVNDREAFREFYESHKNYIWCGYNARVYDVWIARAILGGYNPYDMSQWLIEKGRKGFEFDKSLSSIQLNNYDVRWSQIAPSLKTLEAFMGLDIRETQVSFDIDRPLTEEEIEMTRFYCAHDVYSTLMVLINDPQKHFSVDWDLIKEFDLPLSSLNKTGSQRIDMVMEATRRDYNDEWDFEIEPEIQINKYTHVLEWFKDPKNRNLNKDTKLETTIAGCTGNYGWGGCHLSRDCYFGEGNYIASDIASMYPSSILNHNMFSRSCESDKKYREIYEKRLRLKKAKDPRQACLKLCLNSLYGILSSEFSNIRDPRQAHRICCFGQLAMLDLIEKIEPYVTLISANTDSVYVKIEKPENEEIYYSICKEWEKRMRFVLEHEKFVKIAQSNVNNYVLVNDDGSVKGKGALVKKLNALDYDLAVVNRAVKEYYAHGVPPEKTIWDCDDFMDFMMVKKVSSLYKEAYHGCTFREESVIDEKGKRKKVKVWNGDGVKYDWKTYRVFATTEKLGTLYKKKEDKAPEKFASTPENCKIVNEDIRGWKCSEQKWLDKQWYVDEARHRIDLFKKSNKKIVELM